MVDFLKLDDGKLGALNFNNMILSDIQNITIWSVVDILVVAFIFYKEKQNKNHLYFY